jgi:hypothetical protein
MNLLVDPAAAALLLGMSATGTSRLLREHRPGGRQQE